MRNTLCALALLALSVPMHADEPAVKIGATIFADYTNTTETSSFNVNRAYINVTGTLNKRIAFRVTPDISRETAGGSQQFRLKYAYAQLNLDEWMTKGSYVRFGMQQTPFLDATEQICRYRFQGTGFAEREGYLSSSDTGVTMRYALPNDKGDIHGGFYNGDHYDENARRERLVGQVSYEHARVNAGVEVLSTKDRDLDGRGWSVFATPRLGRGWELLLRHDHNKPDSDSDIVRRRTITGIAYWVPKLEKMTAAVLVDRDALSVTGKDDDTRYGVKLLLVF